VSRLPSWAVRYLIVPLLCLLALVAGYFLRGWLRPAAPPARRNGGGAATAKVPPKTLWWTCSMHPQIKLPKPGLCPICKMPLIPLETGPGGPRTLTVSLAARKLMDIETSAVERRFVEAQVRLFGKVEYDETRLAYITAWVGGRIDRLFVDYTGVTVRKGDHLVYLYSPELLSAQEELIQALQAVRDLKGSGLGMVRETAGATVEAARDKLRLLGLQPAQIAKIEKSGKASDHLTIYAPSGGVVIHKNAQQGMYVKTGTRIYTIADLSRVWVKLDAYESDLMWLRYGQKVKFTTEAYPGRTFTGKVAFIDPVVSSRTRTVKVRVNVPNPRGELKPDMFVRGVVRATVAAGGRVMDPSLAGKWMCRMHPDVVKDGAGKCDVCGMPLERTESLGYVPADEIESSRPLVVPRSAVLSTGKRAVVYVAVKGASIPTFEGREVVLGPRAGDFYIVQGGLKEGEWVVTNGSFKIDSALQIQAKPSMMSPEGGAPPPGHQHGARRPLPPKPRVKLKAPAAFRRQLGAVWLAYIGLAEALAKDDFKAAAGAAQATQRAVAAVDMALLGGDAHVAWMRELANLKKSLGMMAEAKDIGQLRSGFALLSDALVVAIKMFGVEPLGPVYVLKCPMAFNNRGATWLQKDKAVRNPYFGAQMPLCGAVIQTIQDGHGQERAHE